MEAAREESNATAAKRFASLAKPSKRFVAVDRRHFAILDVVVALVQHNPHLSKLVEVTLHYILHKLDRHFLSFSLVGASITILGTMFASKHSNP